MQTYLVTLIVPMIGRDLDARSLFGVVTSTATASMFLTLPFGPALLRRWHPGRLLAWGTIAFSVGAGVSALAPQIIVFAGGRVISGLASGVLAAVSMSTVVSYLSPTWRQRVLASISAMWAIAALAGPSYGAFFTHLLGWRWALVLYLPVLWLARLVVIRNLGHRGVTPAEAAADENLRRTALFSVLLFAGILVISVSSGVPRATIPLLVGGFIMAAAAVWQLMPAGTFRAASPRRAALLALFVVSGAYLGADASIAVIATEVHHFDVAHLGFLLAGSGCAWSLVGMWTGTHPANARGRFLARTTSGTLLLAVGFGLLAKSCGLSEGALATGEFLAGWTVCGVGIGFVYLDSMNRAFEPPETPDGMTDSEVATASVMSESVPYALFGAIFSAIISATVVVGHPRVSGVLYLALAVASLVLIPITRRALPGAR